MGKLQSSRPTTLVEDKTVHEERGDNVEKAATTATSLDAEQGSGGSPRCQEAMGDTIAQTRSERVLTWRMKKDAPSFMKFKKFKEESQEDEKIKKIQELYTLQEEGIQIQDRFFSLKRVRLRMVKIHTDLNVADLLTKGFDAGRFQYMVSSLGSQCSGSKCQDTILGDVNAQTRFEITSKQSIDPPLSRGYTLRSGEDINAVRLKLVLPVFVSAVKRMLMLPVQVSAVEVNPVIYTSCIEQFWATAKVQTVNGVRQLQALVDKKRVIVTESSIRRDLHLDDAEGTDCLPTATIFEELARMGYEKPSQKLTFYKAFFSPQWKYFIHTITQCLSAKSTAWNEFSSSMASLIICLATNQKFNLSKYIFDAMLGDMSHHKKIFVNPSHTKKIFASMKRKGKDFSGRITPLFETMMVQPNQEVGVDSDIPTDSHQTSITTQPSSSRSQKKQSRRKQRKDTAVTQEETQQDDSVPTPFNDPLLSGEDSMQLSELMLLCTNLQKQGRSIEDIDKDADISLVDDTQGRSNDVEMFDIDDLHGDEVVVNMPIGEKQEQSTKEREVNTAVKDSVATTIQVSTTDEGVTAAKIDEYTYISAPTTFKSQVNSELHKKHNLQVLKTKGKAIMIEPEVPLKRKDQVALDEDLTRNLQDQLEAELLKQAKHAKEKR
ncbi:hypothetical protein Tco_1219796 [Tanacetum coccineum]